MVESVDTQDLNLCLHTRQKNLSAPREIWDVEPLKFGETFSYDKDWQSRAKFRCAKNRKRCRDLTGGAYLFEKSKTR